MQKLHKISASVPVTETSSLKLDWLLRVRWLAILGQATVVTVVSNFLGLHLRTLPLWTIIFTTAFTNLAVILLRTRCSKENWVPLLRALLVYDIIALTGLLYFSGGAENPFRFLYVIHIALAALMLKSFWKWILVCFSVLCFLFVYFYGVPLEGRILRSIQLLGDWTAFVVATAFIAYSVYDLTNSLLAREKIIQRFREKEWKDEKLVALATLSAGAAHELSTPLSTIAIAAGELARKLRSEPARLGDALLIREEVSNCQEILHSMSEASGEVKGESFEDFSIEELVAETVEKYEDGISVKIVDELKGAPMRVQRKSLRTTLRSMIKNAVQAHQGKTVRVLLDVFKDQDRVVFRIQDFGEGMSPEVMKRIGDPFFTTKDPGDGMGLGIFLSRSYIESIGGEVNYESKPNQGTTVTVEIPEKEMKA